MFAKSVLENTSMNFAKLWIHRSKTASSSQFFNFSEIVSPESHSTFSGISPILLHCLIASFD